MRIILGFWLVLLAGPASAAAFIATIYSDGLSCPANCDAHVVFHPSVNGTPNAFLPSSSPAAPQKCIPGQECRICFSDQANSCMNVMYRKNGPARNRFDFTPAFFEANCGKGGLPNAVASVCQSFDHTYTRFTENKVYCLEKPTHPGCPELIAKFESARQADEPLWKQCREMGEAKFNQTQPAARKRSNNCAYSDLRTGGPNKKGETWRRLLPAACWPNTYVGRDGLDCCDGRKMALGGLGIECSPFLVPK